MNINNSTPVAREDSWALLLLKLYHLHTKMLFGMLPFKKGCFSRSCVIQWPQHQPNCLLLRMDSIKLRLKRNCSLCSHVMTDLFNTHCSYENNAITNLLHVQPTLQVHILPCLGALWMDSSQCELCWIDIHTSLTSCGQEQHQVYALHLMYPPL